MAKYNYKDSEIDYEIYGSGFEEFDSSFERMEKGYKYTQELFYIYSRSNLGALSSVKKRKIHS